MAPEIIRKRIPLSWDVSGTMEIYSREGREMYGLPELSSLSAPPRRHNALAEKN